MPLSLRRDAMKKRSRAVSEPTQGRRQKAPEPKRGNAPKAAARSKPPPIAAETEVPRLRRDRDEAVEQLSAASDVLKVITSSPGDLKRVFEAILENATRLCEAKFGALWLREGDVFRIGAAHLPSSADVAIYQPDMTFALHKTLTFRLPAWSEPRWSSTWLIYGRISHISNAVPASCLSSI